MLSSSQICVCNCEQQQLQCILLFLLIYSLLRTRRESANPLWLCQSLLYTTQSVNVVEKEAFLTLITRILFYFLDCLQPHFSYFFSLSHYYSKGKIKTNQSIIHAKLSRVKLTLNWANQQQFRSQIFSPPGPRSPCKNAIQCQSVIKMDVSNIMTTKTFPFEMHLSLWLEASKEIMNIRMRRRKTTELSGDWSSIKRFSQRVQWGALENGLSWVQIPLGSFFVCRQSSFVLTSRKAYWYYCTSQICVRRRLRSRLRVYPFWCAVNGFSAFLLADASLTINIIMFS